MGTTTPNMNLYKSDLLNDASEKNKKFSFKRDLDENWDKIDAATGNLSTLNTVGKDSLVNAINEVFDAIPSIPSSIADRNLSNLTDLGNIKLQHAPFGVNYGSKSTAGANLTLYTPVSEQTIYIEKPFLRPNLTANGTLGGADFAVLAESERSATYAAFHVFDGVENTFWQPDRTQNVNWLKFYNPTAIKVTELNVTSWAAKRYNIQSVTIQGSNDNNTWTNIACTLDTTKNENQTITLENENFYQYYKLEITSGLYATIDTIDITATYLQAKTIYVGTDLICRPCVITTAKGYVKTFDEEVVFSITDEADGVYNVFKKFGTGELILSNANFYVSKSNPATPSEGDYFLNTSRTPLMFYKYENSTWIKANDLVFMGTITITSGVITAVENVDFNVCKSGQWVQANGVVQSASSGLSVGVNTYDLSDYLPKDGFTYDVIVGIVARTAVATGYSMIICTTGIVDSLHNSTSYGQFASYDNKYAMNLFSLPVAADRKMSVEIKTNDTDYIFTRLYAYKRTGVC